MSFWLPFGLEQHRSCAVPQSWMVQFFFFFYMGTLSIAFGIRICLSDTLRTTQHIMLEDTQCEKSLTWVQDDESSIVLDMYRTEHVNFLCSVIKCTYLDGLDLYTWTSAAPLQYSLCNLLYENTVYFLSSPKQCHSCPCLVLQLGFIHMNRAMLQYQKQPWTRVS